MGDVYVAITAGGVDHSDGEIGSRRGSALLTDPRTLAPTSNAARDKLIQASWICAFFMTVEFAAGWVANSLALMTDASHLLSDLSAFIIALVAIWVADFPGTNQMSFGFHRAEILGALVSVLLIWCLTIGLVVEALRRLQNPPPVDGRLMFVVAAVGTLANLAMTRILGVHSHGIGEIHSHEAGHACGGHQHHHEHHGQHEHHGEHEHDAGQPEEARVDHHPHQQLRPHEHSQRRFSDARSLSPMERASTDDSSHAEQQPHNSHGDADNEELELAAAAAAVEHPARYYDDETKNVNLRAAYIHALGDLIQNIGVLAASAVIWWKPQWSVVDPVCTFLFSLLVLATTFSIFRDGMHVLMEGSPADLDVVQLREDLLALPHVVELHDLHVWCLSVGKPSLACHLVVDDMPAARVVLRKATLLCQMKFKILHTTIQIDFSSNKMSCGTDAHSRCR